MDPQTIRSQASDLPHDPGVYQFLDDDGQTVIYVGKAVDLSDRVRSYADPRSQRISRMTDRAGSIEIVVTDTETQALLLEANLIKRHQPRYNVRLRDDKSYPLIQITDHEAPKISITRDPEERADVFGPFTDKGHLETVRKAIRETFGLRACSDYKYAGRNRPCLDYDLGLCSAPCTREIDLDTYAEDTEDVRRYLRGESGILAEPIRDEMETAAGEQAYERAANLRDRLSAVESLHQGASGAVAGDDDRTTDVLGVALEGESATVARLHAERGSLLERDRHAVEVPEGQHPGSVLAAFVPQYYTDRSLPDRLLVSDRIADVEVSTWLADAGVSVSVPGAGREATLVDLALKNARLETRGQDGSRALADALGMERATRIEGFDVSHTGGSAVVGSNVAFVDGSAEKSDYRRKRLADRNDDYAAMRSLIEWRGERALEGRDDRPDPDLLVVDGGRGQLSAARDALEATGWTMRVIALAKADEQVITTEETLDFSEDSPHLQLLQRIRDEAHRFALQYHERLRDEVSTALDGVPGVGPTTRERLFGRFGSIGSVRDASIEELCDVPGIGAETAETIQRHL